MKNFRLFVMIAAGALLAGCGGSKGGDETVVMLDPDAMAEMPASAGASVTAFNGTLAGLANDDRANPMGLEQMLPPTSDTTEPQALD